MNKAIFIDKDGTLVKDIPYNGDISKIEFLPNVIPGLLSLQEAGYMIIIVTNQSGIAKGLITRDQVTLSLEWIRNYLRGEGVKITASYYCPHDENKACLCRKPMPGLLVEASLDHNISLPHSVMIGDKMSDVRAGQMAECLTAYVGDTFELLGSTGFRPSMIAKNINEVAQAILLRDKHYPERVVNNEPMY